MEFYGGKQNGKNRAVNHYSRQFSSTVKIGPGEMGYAELFYYHFRWSITTRRGLYCIYEESKLYIIIYMYIIIYHRPSLQCWRFFFFLGGGGGEC